MTKQKRGRAMRLAGIDKAPDEIAQAVKCSINEAQSVVMERERRISSGKPLWFDLGEHPPPR